MSDFTAKDVAFLRKETSAPMMDCKTALVECHGHFEAAKDWLRAKGLKTADKKAGRSTEEGLVVAKNINGVTVMAQIYCETDFVAKTDSFRDFGDIVADSVFAETELSVDVVSAAIAELGENITIGKTARITDPQVAIYMHGKTHDSMSKLAVAVSYEGVNTDVTATAAKQIAMHVAATDPEALSEEHLNAEWIDKERTFLVQQALDSGKTSEIAEKMVAGRMKKFLQESVLLEQPFVVSGGDITVGEFAKNNNMSITDFVRFSL
jgi:elongation factor Ts